MRKKSAGKLLIGNLSHVYDLLANLQSDDFNCPLFRQNTHLFRSQRFVIAVKASLFSLLRSHSFGIILPDSRSFINSFWIEIIYRVNNVRLQSCKLRSGEKLMGYDKKIHFRHRRHNIIIPGQLINCWKLSQDSGSH